MLTRFDFCTNLLAKAQADLLVNTFHIFDLIVSCWQTLFKKFINPNQPSKMSQKGVDKMQEQFVLVGK